MMLILQRTLANIACRGFPMFEILAEKHTYSVY
jgi:hypothetical protein